MQKLPLTGIRILALEFMWAGPLNTLMLTNLGAEVIKVEHHQARGPAAEAGKPAILLRAYANGETGERPWNRSGFLNQFMLGKRSLVMDLIHPRGKELFLKLVEISDVVQDNYSARVMPNFGLDYPDLKEVNPRIIMVRQSGFGVVGPYKDYIAGGCPTGVHGGLPFYHGYHDDEPMRPESCIVDPWAGLHACCAVLTALWQRRRTGQGQFIDSGQCESVATVLGDRVLGYQIDSDLPPRVGNRHLSMAPHNCYPCRGEDKWIAIAVATDDEWSALCRVMGDPPWTEEERFSDQSSRSSNQDELDRRIGEWTRGHDHIELMHILQKEGIAAGAVLDQREVMEDPHLKERRCYVEIDHPETGIRPYARSPWHMSRALQPAQRAPLMGEHNRYVLGELLGLSEQEITELEKEEVISDRPLDAV
jgi:benzylsuccinate CoA-transferase BbsF subunit